MNSAPNILYILADDLGWGDLSCHGSPIRTPTIDRLIQEGVELGQHYVCPMCTPTRASLLTGRHPGRFGAHATTPSNPPVLPDSYPTLATVLRDYGYDTGLFGKWHLGSSPRFGPNSYGFNTAYGSLAGGIDPYNHFYKRGDYSVNWHENGILIEEQGHVTDLITRAAVEWIEARQRSFFCYVPFTAVHVPIKPTQDWLNAYQNDNFDKDPLKDASFRKYAAYTSHMDWAISQLLEALERTCQRENTLVIFSSDNGAINDCPLHSTDTYPGYQEDYPRLGSNGPLRGVKAQLYEGGIRTPTFVNWRSKLQPGSMNYPVQIVDWMPTLTALCSATPTQNPLWDGTDIWPLIEGNAPAEEKRMYWNFRGGRNLGLRLGDWKLTDCEVEGGRRMELFNIADDPYEKEEISADYPKKVVELNELIVAERRLDDSSKRPDMD